ncbi:MAG TPA: SUMF1/EgtB/PvdO family nonheme iron enzyme [Planctomycetota bacterium]|nr:SUMF1/EgtB/PvdO family nonheme iron enzyme [Planctomycetota bacterium]
MASLFRKLISRRGGQSAVEVQLAAFGKHPGWDDHIEDLGLETNRLIAAKRVLYTQGIAGNIEAGAWEKLGEQERLDDFHHLFLWHTAHDLILGRMWSSRDGKGRTRYPMVICSQVTGASLDWTFGHVLPLLDTIEARCLKTTSAVTVRAVLDDTRQMLLQAATEAEAAERPLPALPRTLAYLADRPEMAPNHQGIHRILYVIERELAAYHQAGGDASATSTAMLRSSHIRVPTCASTPQGAAALWLGFLLSRLDPLAPMLLILPLHQPWVDIVVGEPGPQQFFCVRASLQAVPMATEIPYNLDEAFISRGEKAIEGSRQERTPLPDVILKAGALPRPRPQVAPAPSPGPAPAPSPPGQARPAAQPRPPAAAAPPGRPAGPAAPAPRAPAPAPAPRPAAPHASHPGAAAPAPRPPAAAPSPAVEARPAPRPLAGTKAFHEMETVPSAPAVPAHRPVPAAAWREPGAGLGVGQRLLRLWPLYLLLIVLAVLAFLFLPLLFGTSVQAPEKPKDTGPFTWIPEEHGKAWQSLCDAYRGWFPGFHRKLNKERLDAWRRDAGLARLIVMRVDQAGDRSVDPRDIAGVAGGDYVDLGLNPPKAAKTREGVETTRRALEIVKGVEESVARWASYDELSLKPLAAAFAARGWSRQAGELEAAAAALTPGPNLAEAIDAALRVKLQAVAIELTARKIAQHEQAVQILGDDAAARIHDLFLAETRDAESFEPLLAKVAAVEAKTAAIAASGKALQDVEKALRAGDAAAAAQAFVAAVRASAGRVSSLEDISAALNALKVPAQSVNESLAAIKAHCTELQGLHDKALADKLWALARAQALAAGKLDDMAQRLAQARADVAKAGERRKDLQRQLEALKPLGDQVPARLQQRLSAALASASALGELLKAMDGAHALADAIASRWAKVSALAKVLGGSGDKVLAAFPRHVAAAIAAEADPAALPDRLDRLEAQAAGVAAVLQGDWKQGRIDRELFAQHSDVHRAFAAGKMADETLPSWRKEVADYYKVAGNDPRQPGAWKADLEDLRLRVDFLREEPEAAKRQLADKSHRRCEQLDADIAKVLPLPWIRKHEAAITQRVAAIAAELEGLKADLKDAVEHPRKWLARIRASAPLTASKAVNDEWAKRRDALVAPAATPEAIEKDRKGYMKLWRDVEALRTFLTQLDDPQQLPKGLPKSEAPADDLSRAIAAEADKQREAALQAIVAAIPWKDARLPALGPAELKQDKAWTKAVGTYTQWRDDAGKLLADCQAIAALLDGGYGPDDKPEAAPRTARQLCDAWQKRTVPRELLPHFAPTLDRLQKLLALEAFDRKQLVERAAALREDEPPQVAMILWRSLGKIKDWPGTLAELNQDLALRALLARVADKLKAAHPHAVRWVPDELARQGPLRWETCFNAVARRSEPKDLADPDLAAIVQLAGKFGDVAQLVKALAPESQLRWKLHHFRRAAAGLRDDEPKEKLDALVGGFLKEALALGAAARQPGTAKLLGDLQEFARQKMSNDPKVGLDKAGPAGGSLAGKWKAEIGDEGKSVTYTWDERGHRLAFLRVEPKDQASKACYLCATETPVGLFLDVVRAADKWGDLGLLLDKPSAARIDVRKGPRTCEWARQRDEMSVPRTWLVAEAGTSELYPQGLNAGRPSTQHPAQCISAPAAIEVACLLGCRLPSSAEWQAALAAAGQGTKANLRDATWRKQQEFMRKKAETVRPEWPDAATFPAPESELGKGVKRGAEALVVSDADDGALWFSPVGSPGGGFQHLAGNVAELVFDQPAAFDDAFLKAPAAPAAEAVRGFVQKHEASIGVIGASALSPPELWDGKARPFDKAWPLGLVKGREGKDSFADVGFRLAFTAPTETPADRLKRLLRRWGYAALDSGSGPAMR